jgi:hypothetical protein
MVTRVQGKHNIVIFVQQYFLFLVKTHKYMLHILHLCVCMCACKCVCVYVVLNVVMLSVVRLIVVAPY